MEAKADVNAKQKGYDTPPPTCALENGGAGFVFVLDGLTLCSHSEKSPLHYSSEGGHVEACRFLVEAKADVNAEIK